MLVLTTLLIIRSLEVGKTEHMRRLCQVQNICNKPVKDVEKIGKSTLGKKDHQIVNDSTDLEIICARLAEASSFSEYPPSPSNLCADTYVVQNSSNSVNISERLEKDDEFLKILNGFLNSLDEASVSPDVHRNRLDTFTHR